MVCCAVPNMFVKLMFLLIVKDAAEQCTGIGRFLIPNTNCTEYIVCTDFENKLIGHTVTCPNYTRFNPRARRCSPEYVCSDHICQATDIEEGQNYLDPNDQSYNVTYITCDFNEIYGTLTASYRSCPSYSIFQVLDASQYNRGVCMMDGKAYEQVFVYNGDADATKPVEVIQDVKEGIELTRNLANTDVTGQVHAFRLGLIYLIIKYLT